MADVQEIAPGVTCLPISIVNVYFVGAPGSAWVLVDTGTPKAVSKIKAAAEARYGAGARPAAIVLTHGHFDHAGNALELAQAWDVPVYAHRMELPYLTGRADYPPKDPTIGGAISFLSRVFPTHSIDLGDRVQALPTDGALPALSDWEWHATPGHISLFRAKDRVLLAGDACATVDMDSFPALATKKQQVSRPPAPFNSTGARSRRRCSGWRACGPSSSAAATACR